VKTHKQLGHYACMLILKMYAWIFKMDEQESVLEPHDVYKSGLFNRFPVI
jgi:hypothetical protein